MASTFDFVGCPHETSSLARVWQFVPKGNISLRSERSRSYRSCVIYNKSHWLLDIMAGIIKLYNLIVHLIRQENECGHRMRINIRCNASTGRRRFLHFNWRIVLVIVFLATLARMLAESHERLKMKKLSVLLCLSAAVFIIVRRLKRNHPGETLSTEEDCSWLNHGGFPTKGFDGP